MRNVTLLFDNDTAETVHTLSVGRSSVDSIMEWYGSFYAGDKYRVFVNGDEMWQDVNGGRELDTIEAVII